MGPVSYTHLDVYKRQEVHCSKYGAQKVKLPAEEDKSMYFKNFTLCHRVPYTVYADFESFVVPIQKTTGNQSENVAHHVPASFCYLIVDWTGKAVNEPVLYRGKHVIDTFLSMLLADVEGLDTNFNKPIIMTMEDERGFQDAIR